MAKTNTAPQDPSGWVGWIYFGAFLMFIAGIFQSIAGLAALFKDEVYIVSQNSLLALDYTQWGWVHLTLGVVLILSTVSMVNGNMWGRFVGVLLATLSAIANFAFVSAYPLWSIMIITMDVLIIYALMVHGREARVE